MMYLLFVLGLVLLIVGGNWLVDGAVGLARRLRLSELLIGATVVSVGTTVPEVVVSATSAFSGHGQMAYGNAIGSVICNAALIAAIVAVVRPPRIRTSSLVTPVIFFFVAAALFTACAWIFGRFDRWVGILLLVLCAAYFFVTVRQMLHRSDAETLSSEPPPEPPEELSEEPSEGAKLPLWRAVVMLVVGVALVAVGANLLVDNGTLIARSFGVPESVIALTAVALGTSLPELFTAVTALIKRRSAISLGNIIGANVLNLVLVCGVSVTLSPFSVPENSTLFGINSTLIVDLPVLFAVMLILCIVPLRRKRLTRPQGAGLLAIYAAFCAYQFILA